MTSPFELRFIVVSGKGGVGRTTVAAALARAAATAGKRVLLAETTATDRMGRLFGRAQQIGTDIVALAPGIDAVNITPARALREYGVKVLRSELVTRALFENRAARSFLGAVPGLDAYAVLGKAWWHTTERADGHARYDLVILDGPASGHVALMLRIPHAILTAMPKGPLAGDARAIRDLLSDPAQAALLIVTLAEELPAREAVELVNAARGPLAVPVAPLIVNAVPDGALSVPAVDAVLDGFAAAAGDVGPPALAATLRLASAVRAQRRAADAIIARLKQEIALPIVTLPRVPTAESGPPLLDALAPHLVF